jgi:uncharacterized protein
MRKFLPLILLSLGANALAQDQAAPPIDPAKRAAIEELLTLMKVDETTKQLLPQVQQMMVQATEKAIPPELQNSPDQSKLKDELRDFQNRLFDLLKDKIAFANMKPQYVRAYDETFSAEEIAGIATFYKSPAGQAFVTKLPVLTSKTMQLTQGMLMELMPELQKMNATWAEEMKRKYGDSGAK